MRIKVILIVLVAGFLFIAGIVVNLRLDANEQYRKYYDYSMQTLLKYGSLETVAVKPEYRTLLLYSA